IRRFHVTGVQTCALPIWMHAERYSLPEHTARLIDDTRAAGGAVWAVGTTVTRTLESCVGEDGRMRPGAGWTSLFIRPPWTFRAESGRASCRANVDRPDRG